MSDARVLVDLAEQVLSVDQVEWSPEQPWELQPEPTEVLVLRLGHVPDDLGLDPGCVFPEALPDPVLGPGTGDDEVVLVERHEVRVVEIDRVLERKERAEPGERHQRLVDRPQRRRGADLVRQPIPHHPFQQTQMVRMFPGLT